MKDGEFCSKLNLKNTKYFWKACQNWHYVGFIPHSGTDRRIEIIAVPLSH